MYNTQKEKEDAIYDKVIAYQRNGDIKSVAVRKAMVDFMYSTESAIYGILKRVANRRASND